MNDELTPLAAWLRCAENFVRRFVVLSDDQAAATVLWVAHTYAFDAAFATAYLSISSAEMESGKTRLLEVLRLLVAKPWFTGRTTPAALTRKIDGSSPTLLLDESDPAFNGDKEYAEVLRGVLNSGYRRGGAVTVCVGQGANLTARDFSTFCPKAIAGIGKLPDTVASRSIPIRLKKRKPTEPIERFRERREQGVGESIALALEERIDDVVDGLRDAEPDLPDELSDRAQDVWEPLLAIADAADGPWPERARSAAKALSGPQEPDEGTIGTRLLGDVRDVWGDRRIDLTTKELLVGLRAIEEAPWDGWNGGEGLKARTLANKLRLYGIRSKDLHVGEGDERHTVKGYKRADFEDPWERYLPRDPEPIRAKRANCLVEPKTAPRYPRQDSAVARIENPEKPHGYADGADGADRSGGYEERAAPTASPDRFTEAVDEPLDEEPGR